MAEARLYRAGLMSRPGAIFDLDGTLLAGTSAERLFLRRALRAHTLGCEHFVRGAVRALGWVASGRAGILTASKAYLHDLPCSVVERIGVECVHEDVRPRLRPSMLAALDAHRAAGDAIVLLSGTLDFLGTEVARKVGADVAACTVLERRDGVFTGRVVPPYPHGAGKLQVLEQLALANDLDLAASHAYANHGSDARHLERVGFAHAVEPDSGLRRLARARGWRIHEA